MIALCLLMFAGIVALDILTPQRLVAAILLNIPLALSGLVFKRRFTLGLVVVAIVADAVAGAINANQERGFDSISLFNRTLLATSFALVGWMTVTLSQTSSRLNATRLREQRARRERDRERITAVGQERTLEAAISRAARVLASAFEARGVVLASGGVRVFGAPRASFPGSLAAWGAGTPLPPRLVGAAPPQPVLSEQPGEYGLTANRALVAGLEWGGRPPVLLALLEPSVDAADTLEELLPALRDALERAELGERLEVNRTELERRAGVIRDLVYAFSHDLRTPLVANGVNMRLALEGAFGELPEAYRRTLLNGMEANEDLLALADSLLLLARLESGEAQPRPPESVSLEAATRSSAARLPVSAQLHWEVQGETAVDGNPADLRRVIQNLLENAVKFSPPQSPIEINLDRRDNLVRLEVSDRGAGVPLDLEPRLFQRFSSGRAGGGTGLGLYLARRIIEAHGGRIGYHPRVGGGSVFWLELPAASSQIGGRNLESSAGAVDDRGALVSEVPVSEIPVSKVEA